MLMLDFFSGLMNMMCRVVFLVLILMMYGSSCNKSVERSNANCTVNTSTKRIYGNAASAWNTYSIADGDDAWFTGASTMYNEELCIAYSQIDNRLEKCNVTLSVVSGGRSYGQDIGIDYFKIDSVDSLVKTSIASTDEKCFILYSGHSGLCLLVNEADDHDHTVKNTILTEVKCDPNICMSCSEDRVFIGLISRQDATLMLYYAKIDSDIYDWKCLEICRNVEGKYSNYISRMSCTIQDNELWLFYGKMEGYGKIDLYCSRVDITSEPTIVERNKVIDNENRNQWSFAETNDRYVYATYRDKSVNGLYLVYSNIDNQNTNSLWNMLCIEKAYAGESTVNIRQSGACKVIYYDSDDESIIVAELDVNQSEPEVYYEKLADYRRGSGADIQYYDFEDKEVVIYGSNTMGKNIVYAYRFKGDN